MTAHGPVPYPRSFFGHAKTSDYTLTEQDEAVGVDASTGPVMITVPSVATVSTHPRLWWIKRMDDSDYAVVIKLAVPTDSMFGVEFSAISLQKMGQGIEIVVNANSKYTFSDWSGTEDYAAHAAVSTQTPSLSGTTLSMEGWLDDIGSSSGVEVYFRWRDVTAASGWTETTKVTVSAVGGFSETATVTAGHVYEVQALVDDDLGDTHSGAVLATSVNYYSSAAEAMLDGLERYWPMQEAAGVDTTAGETMASDDMTMAGGVTIGSDVINGNTIYKRIFGANDWGEASYAPVFTGSGRKVTIMIQVDCQSAAGDHTILNFGRNVLSLASDGTSIQLEVNNSITAWSSATPFAGILNLFITVNRNTGKTRMHVASAASTTRRIDASSTPSSDASYTRLARGSSGDANHQDFEYLDNGEVRSLAVWGRRLTTTEMKDVCSILDTDGGLVVA